MQRWQNACGEHDSCKLLTSECSKALQCASMHGVMRHVSPRRPVGRLTSQSCLTPAWVLSTQDNLLTPSSKQIIYVVVTTGDAWKKDSQDHVSKLTMLLSAHTAKSMAHQRSDAVSASGDGMPRALEKTQDDLTSCP